MSLLSPFRGPCALLIRWRDLPFLRIVVQLFLATIFPTFIQPLFNKFTPLSEGPVRTKVEALAKKLKFPLTHLYEIDGSKRSSHSNAFVLPLPRLGFSCGPLTDGLA